MSRNRRIATPCALLIAIALGGCISMGPRLSEDVDLTPEPTPAEQSQPLGGEALTQRAHEMRRAHRDLVHFHATLLSLNHRRNRNGQILFRGFLDSYLGVHLEPLLSGEWQSRHPELAAMDASLRLTKAELLIQMREPSRAQSIIEEVAHRYAGREEMIVDYPIGAQGTLREALDVLRTRKWWRG